MESVTLSVTVPKELNDIRVALLGVVNDLRQGKNILETGVENLQALQAALVGIGNVPNEIKMDEKDSIVLAFHLGGELLASFLVK